MPTEKDILIERKQEIQRELAQAKKRGLKNAINGLKQNLASINQQLKNL